MAVTKTELIIHNLNYSCESRLSSGTAHPEVYPMAISNIVQIFSNQIGSKTPEEIQEFTDQVSLVNYLDNVESYKGITEIPLFLDSLITKYHEYNEVEFERGENTSSRAL